VRRGPALPGRTRGYWSGASQAGADVVQRARSGGTRASVVAARRGVSACGGTVTKAGAAAERTGRILVVDDELAMREMCRLSVTGTAEA
jgi:hypothetical protein